MFATPTYSNLDFHQMIWKINHIDSSHLNIINVTEMNFSAFVGSSELIFLGSEIRLETD